MKKISIFKYVLLVLGLIFIWFLAVDKSWFVEKCDDCFYSRDIIEYRLFTLPVYRTIHEDETPISYVADKLGVPCSHQNVKRWHKYRFWGLVICYRPCISGVSGLASSNWDSKRELIDAAIPKLLESDPNLPQEFKKRVLEEHDLEYCKELWNKLLPKEEPNE